MFRAVLLEVLSGHVLCGALLELHVPVATLLGCALRDSVREVGSEGRQEGVTEGEMVRL